MEERRTRRRVKESLFFLSLFLAPMAHTRAIRLENARASSEREKCPDARQLHLHFLPSSSHSVAWAFAGVCDCVLWFGDTVALSLSLFVGGVKRKVYG